MAPTKLAPILILLFLSDLPIFGSTAIASKAPTGYEADEDYEDASKTEDEPSDKQLVVVVESDDDDDSGSGWQGPLLTIPPSTVPPTYAPPYGDGAVIGKKCKINGDCTSAGHAYCRIVSPSCGYGSCECVPSFYADGDVCKYAVHKGDKCDLRPNSDSICVAGGPNMICRPPKNQWSYLFQSPLQNSMPSRMRRSGLRRYTSPKQGNQTNSNSTMPYLQQLANQVEQNILNQQQQPVPFQAIQLQSLAAQQVFVSPLGVQMPPNTPTFGTCDCAEGYHYAPISLDVKTPRQGNSQISVKQGCVPVMTNLTRGMVCFDHVQCLFGMICDNNNLCNCDSHQVPLGPYGCRDRILGDYCTYDSQCERISGAVCVGGVCGCQTPNVSAEYFDEFDTVQVTCWPPNAELLGEGKPCNIWWNRGPIYPCKQPLICTACGYDHVICARPVPLYGTAAKLFSFAKSLPIVLLGAARLLT